MLTSAKEKGLSFIGAEPGDEFYLVRVNRYTDRPQSVTAYKVLRVGKRDVVITAIGSAREERIHRSTPLARAYLTAGEVASARAEIRLLDKQYKAWKSIESASFEMIPEDLADQIIAWKNSLCAGKDSAE